MEKSLISFFEIRETFTGRSKHYADFKEALLLKLEKENIFFDPLTNQKKCASVVGVN